MGTLQQGNRLTITVVLVTNFNFYAMTRNKIFKKILKSAIKILNLQFKFYGNIIVGTCFDDIIW